MSAIRNRQGTAALLIFAYLLICLPAFATTESDNKTTPDQKEKADQYTEFNRTVLSSLASEKTNLSRLTDELARTQLRKGGFDTEITTYRIQLSTHGNLLAIPNINIKDLERAALNNRAALEHVTGRIEAVTREMDRTAQAARFNREQSQLNEQQLDVLKTEAAGIEDGRTHINNLKTLIHTFSKKEKRLDQLTTAYHKRKNELEEIQKALEITSKKLENRIKVLKKEKRFQRRAVPLTPSQWRHAGEEFTQLKDSVRLIMTARFWENELSILGANGWGPILSATFIFGVLVVLLHRVKNYCNRLKDRPVCADFPWRGTGLAVLAHSLPLFGITLYATLFASIYHLESLPIAKMGLWILWTFVFTRWTLDFFLFSHGAQLTPALDSYLFNLRILLYIIRGFVILYAFMDWLITVADTILFFMRMMFEVVLLAWFVCLRLKIIRSKLLSAESPAPRTARWIRLLTPPGYIIFGVGCLMELSGYGGLAPYWYISWGLSTVTILLAIHTFLMLREWHLTLYQEEEQTSDEPTESKWPMQWVMYQFIRLLWAISILVAFIFSWGASHTFIDGFIRVLKYPLAVGQMRFSLLGGLYAFLILFMTHVLAKLSRHMLKDRLFLKSGMEHGLQESIVSISAYLIWGIGILVALHAFGLNTTSLAVALGALGIGLGFGLQNIFNNFISGIILLFERPIQVGDEVEINGIWSTVKKINVRSTVVQTLDNAAIIIPNSEFISSQVVNWSFKDKRIRRRIQIGVAYGSDIELVRETLLEIAEKTPHVLKTKKKDVIFSDFGDSALIFILRYYTTTDHIWTSETSIRFEIDRLFKERNIVIAFPQQDVHLHHAIPMAVPAE